MPGRIFGDVDSLVLTLIWARWHPISISSSITVTQLLCGQANTVCVSSPMVELARIIGRRRASVRALEPVESQCWIVDVVSTTFEDPICGLVLSLGLHN